MSSYAVLSARTLDSLSDPSGVRYPADLLEQAYLHALREYSSAFPLLVTSTHTVASAGRVQTLSVANLLAIVEVIYPHDPASPLEGSLLDAWYLYWVSQTATLYIGGQRVPTVGEKISLTCATQQTLNGLDAASKTTLPAQHYDLLSQGAPAHAALLRAAALSEAQSTDAQTPSALSAWATAQLDFYRSMLAGVRATLQPGRSPLPQSRQGWALDGNDSAFSHGRGV
jgi:hypothetical protein